MSEAGVQSLYRVTACLFSAGETTRGVLCPVLSSPDKIDTEAVPMRRATEILR